MRCAVAAMVLVANVPIGLAHAEEPAGDRVEFLSAAREISHGDSASRDTASLQMINAPRPQFMGGGELSLVTLRWTPATLRIGLAGFIELESAEETNAFFPADFWRGHFGFHVAYSPDAFARRVCGKKCAFEALVALRHESAHHTTSDFGDDGESFRSVPQVGDFVLTDIAAQYRAESLSLTLRVQHRFFVPNRSSYVHAPGVDVSARWRTFSKLHLFSSLFAEYMVGVDAAPNAYLVRNMTGVVLPSRSGDIFAFLTAAVGHRKGLNVLTEERSLGFGFRVAFE